MEFSPPQTMTLLEIARRAFPDSSRSTLQKWIRNGRFSSESKKLYKENLQIQKDQKITIQETFKAPKISGLNILFEDRYFIVIDKPEGLLSVPLDENTQKKHALGLLKEHYETDQIFAVHRIDRETSGILLFARGKASENYFDSLFESHDILREYYAIVEGKVQEKQGMWKSKLLELPSLDVIESEQGKEAITYYSVIHQSPKYTYLKLRLETGKKHQIRVHCQRAGHPVVGDLRYGSSQNPLKRLCLHACTLGFNYPFSSKRRVQITSPLPKSFQVLGGQKAFVKDLAR